MENYKFDNFMDKFPIGMAYVPYQKNCKIFENLEEAYYKGTIFPELDKPFTGRRCVKWAA